MTDHSQLNTGYSSSSASRLMPGRRLHLFEGARPTQIRPLPLGLGPSLFRFEGTTFVVSPAKSPATGDRPPRARPLQARASTCLESTRAAAPLENSKASTSIFVLQATKSQRWMPWRLKPKKDVGDCEKPRGAVYQASIRGCPNGETRHPSWGVTPT
jgi:hypothetical protein